MPFLEKLLMKKIANTMQIYDYMWSIISGGRTQSMERGTWFQGNEKQEEDAGKH